MRNEGLEELQRIVDMNKRIDANPGEILNVVKARLADSNKNLVVSALGIMGGIATAMGKPIEKQYKFILPSVLKGTKNEENWRKVVRGICVCLCLFLCVFVTLCVFLCFCVF